jgi:hypothetical protein
MVPLDSRGVIFSLENSFTKHDKRPGKNDVIGRFPFLPYVIEGLPSPFGAGTLEEQRVGEDPGEEMVVVVVVVGAEDIAAFRASSPTWPCTWPPAMCRLG